MPRPASAEAIHRVLPQTQCQRCGYDDCRRYAEAIAEGAAAINQCPPGGEEGIHRLARLTGQAVQALNPTHGLEGPRQLAVIDEAACIGCTLCLQACPVDAIVGGPKAMHTVVAAWCTGCELCVPVCPVDCIALEAASGHATGWQAWSSEQADTAQTRYAARTARLQREAAEQSDRLEAATGMRSASNQANLAPPVVNSQALVEAALAKARARRHGP